MTQKYNIKPGKFIKYFEACEKVTKMMKKKYVLFYYFMGERKRFEIRYNLMSIEMKEYEIYPPL